MATVLLVEDDPAARQGLELALRRLGYEVRRACPRHRLLRPHRLPRRPALPRLRRAPSTIYLRASDSAVQRVDGLLAAQADPENPGGVQVSQPSAALVAQAEAKSAFNVLFLGLGAVALLVGAIGVANIMVISVLERRSEIGLRRALGATRGHIRVQFLAEAILLSLTGGIAGIAAGAAAVAVYAHAKGWATVIPSLAWAGGLAAAILIGAAAGLLPALRAARLSPTQTLWSL
jgi:putative ABC transport system permease protein